MAITLDGAQTLPTNPNCVAFAADAQDVLKGRRWLGLQQSCVRAMDRFHRDSGLPILSTFSWRTSTNRKNQRHPELMAAFVIDGPATRAHLESLEASMSMTGVYWSPSQVERIPTQAVQSAMWVDGECVQLWRGTEQSPILESMQWTEAGVMTVERPLSEVSEREVLKDAVHRVGRPPTFADHDSDLERMRLAFARDFVTRIIEADGKVVEEEREFLATVFPNFLIERLELSSDDDKIRWQERASKELPSRLGHHDKLAMVGLFFSACYSDGNLDAREMKVLKTAGESLGLTRHEVVAYLQRFW